MNRRTTIRARVATTAAAGLLAGLTAGPLVLAPTTAVAAGDGFAAESTPRLPFQREVAEIFPDAEGGTRRSANRTGLRGPDVSRVGDGVACNAEVRLVEATSGRTAIYRPGPDAPGPVIRPLAEQRDFTSPAAARTAFREVRAAVQRCQGLTRRNRVETLTWSQLATPPFGQARIGWTLSSGSPGGPRRHDLHFLALRDDKLVHVQVSRNRARADQGLSQRLMWTALRTLTSN